MITKSVFLLFAILLEDYLNAIKANLMLNIGPEPIHASPHQNWVHRRTELIQINRAAQNEFPVLPIEIQSNWKWFTFFYKCSTLKETINIKEFYATNKTAPSKNRNSKRKSYCLNTHDSKNTKMTETLMITLTPQLRKIAVKREHQIRTSWNLNETRVKKNLTYKT